MPRECRGLLDTPLQIEDQGGIFILYSNPLISSNVCNASFHAHRRKQINVAYDGMLRTLKILVFLDYISDGIILNNITIR